MVLFSYQSGSAIRTGTKSGSGTSAESSAENDEGKWDHPKTAYIDKIFKFDIDGDAYDQKCDLFFLCQDGEIGAHRLVISNSSKYIMAMQDDQPPWHPVYISVPDLPKEIVHTLVKLAYTGEMNVPPTTSSDELFDAMQTLGWVHTDCLTSIFTDSPTLVVDGDFTDTVSSKTAESLETVLKMNFPVNNKEGTESSDDEDGIEIGDVPDVPISDDEEHKNNIEKTPKKKGSANLTKSPRSARTARRSARSVKNEANSVKQEPVAPQRSTRRKANPVITTLDDFSDAEKEDSEKDSTPKKSEVTARKGRQIKAKTEIKNDVSSKKNKSKASTPVKSPEPEPEPEPVVEPQQEAVRSRTRTIRKPKKFDDAVVMVMTPTKRKDSPSKMSPIKTPAKAENKAVKEEQLENKKASNSVEKPAENNKSVVDVAVKALNKSRRSTSSDTLITSYFTKKNSQNSDDTSSGVPSVPLPTKVEIDTEPETTKVQSIKGRKSSKTEEKVNENEKTNDSEVNEDKVSNNKDIDDVTQPSTTLRKRVKSTASSKSDKDGGSLDAPNSNHANLENAATSASSKRKRSFQEGQEADPSSEGNQEPNVNAYPAKRGRKTSTISNASKSSKTSSKAGADSTVVDEVDAQDNIDLPKRKRSRQD